MKKYYNILNIPVDDFIFKDPDIKFIINYKNTIKRFANLPFLTKQMIVEIKDIKEAYYVLKNKELKKKYDSLYKKEYNNNLISLDEIEINSKNKENNVMFKERDIYSQSKKDYIDNTKIFSRLNIN
jgi:hypothetical protein